MSLSPSPSAAPELRAGTRRRHQSYLKVNFVNHALYVEQQYWMCHFPRDDKA